MWRSRVPLVILMVFMAAPAFAQIGGRPFEVSGQGGWFAPDARTRMRSAPMFGGTLGWRPQSWMVFEGQAMFASSEADTFPEQKMDFTSFGLDLRLNLRPAEDRVVPFVLMGLASTTHSTTGHLPDDLNRGSPSLGLGTLVNFLNQRTYLRFQVRDAMFRDRDAKEFSNNFALSAGLHYVIGGKPKDSDLDGVREWLDQCPATPLGARVDARGCPNDADRDSVLDGLDKCENTPAGCTIDPNGCPSDGDGDGVCDGLDTCADTPKGASVNAQGCPADADGDGVFDGIDTCPDTPKGATVNAQGCPADADSDGVPDGIDKCPGTSVGLKVDATGCSVQYLEMETELLDTGMIRLQNVNFEAGKATLLPESYGTLDVVGAVLGKWPELKVEVGGHTDSRGSTAANQKLSEARARAIIEYLTRKYPDLKADQYRAKGYGEGRALVPNTTEPNMAKNRRVEFVVQNKDVLKRETERRRQQPK